MKTINQAIYDAIEACKEEQSTECPAVAARELAIAITHLEDAAMRVNRGIALKREIFKTSDVQADVEAEIEKALRESEAALIRDGEYAAQQLENSDDLSSAA